MMMGYYEFLYVVYININWIKVVEFNYGVSNPSSNA
jgi:hypothetical protein